MSNFIEKMKELYRHNQFFAVACIVVIAASVWLIGCESKTQSILYPDTTVSRDQLNLEIKVFKEKVKAATADLDKQDMFKQELFNIGLAVAQGGTVNPIGAGVTLLGILGIGAVADNRKKDSLIKTLQNNTAA